MLKYRRPNIRSLKDVMKTTKDILKSLRPGSKSSKGSFMKDEKGVKWAKQKDWNVELKKCVKTLY